MALPKSGVELVAQNASAFFRDMDRVDIAFANTNRSAATAAAGVTAFGQSAQMLKLDSLANVLADQKTRLDILNQRLDTTKQKYGESSVQARTQEAAIARLTDKIGENERAYGLLAGQINAEAEASDASAAAAENAARETAKQASAAAGAARAADDARGFNESLARAFGDVGTKADAATPKVSGFSEIVTGGLRRVGEIGVNAIAGLGTALVGFVGDSITVAGDYEAALGRFASVSGSALTDAGLSVDTFSDKFLQLGADTQFSALQAADAANNLAKGGVPLRDILGGAAEATLNLASAAELELAPAAEIVAKQLGVWGKDGVTATNVVDALAQAANASTVDVQDLALGMANAGGSARVAGVSFQETVQTLGILAPGFSSAGDAGTSFKTFLSRLPGTTAPSIKALTDLGLYTRESGSAFYNASGQFIGMKAASELLQGATANLSEEQKTLAFNTIFGADAIRTAAMLAEGGGEQFDTFAKSMDSVGTAAEQAKLRNQGFNFAMETLKGSVETVAILFGQKVLPAITGFINDAIIPAVNGIGTLIDNFGSVVDTIEDYLLPAVAMAGVAFVGFAVTQAGGLVTALLTAIVNLALTASGFIAAGIAAGKAALGFAAANAPLIVLTATVGLAVFAFNKYSEQVEDAKTKTLEMAKGYGQAGEALDGYNELQKTNADLSPKVNAEAQAQAFIVQRLRGELELATDAYYAVGGGTAENFNRIVNLNEALKTHSAALDTTVQRNSALAEEQAKQKQAMLDSMTGVVAASGSWSAYNEQVGMSKEIMEEALGVLAKVREDGVGVFDSITQSRVDYQSEMERLTTEHEAKMVELQKAGNQEAIDAEVASFNAQRDTATASYMEQQAAQRAHLGQMLIDYINAQAQLNPEFRKSSGALISAISEEYGVQASLSQQLYGSMLDDIDAYATSGGGDIDALVGKLRENEQAATDTQQDMDALAKDYRLELLTNLDEEKISLAEMDRALALFPTVKNTELLTNFLEGKIDAEEFIKAAEAIPTSVTTEVGVVGKAEAISTAEQIGADIQAGVARGVTNNSYMVANAMQKTAASAMASAKGYLEIRSPGKRPAREIGEPISEGVAIGILKKSRDVSKAMQEMLAPIADQSDPAFIEMTDKVFATVERGISAFDKLAKYTEVPRDKLLAFSYNIRDAVADFDARSREIGYALENEAAPKFATAAGNAIEVIGRGVDAFTKLSDYKGVPAGAMEALSHDIARAVWLMIQMAQTFDVSGTAAAGVFAESVGKIIAPIGGAVSAFGGLSTYSGVAPGVMEMLYSDIQRAVLLMIQISQSADTEGVTAASAFSVSVKAVFDALSAGINALDAIRDYQSIPADRMASFESDFSAALATVGRMAAASDGMLADAQRWQMQLESFAEAIRAGADAVGSLDGLSVNASASVSASVGGGGDGVTALAGGGFMQAGRPYLVGDGPGGRITPYTELVVPAQHGRVFSAPETRSMLTPPPTPAAVGSSMAISQSTQTTRNYNLNLTTQQSAGSVMRDFRMMETFSL